LKRFGDEGEIRGFVAEKLFVLLAKCFSLGEGVDALLD